MPLSPVLDHAVEALNASPEFAGKVQTADVDAGIFWVGDCGCGRCRCSWACLTVEREEEGDVEAPHLTLSFHRDAHPGLVASLVRVLYDARVPFALLESWKVSKDGEVRFESDGYRRPHA